MYVAEQNGQILAIADSKDTQKISKVDGWTLGIAFRPGTRDLYISARGRVLVSRGSPEGSFSSPEVIVDGLPTGRHQNDQIAFAPGGQYFFLGVGSTCDACDEANPRSATIMRISADGNSQEIFARGLRNPFGLAIHPQTGELFATDNGRDVPPVGVPDELNVISENGHYGWFDCWGRGKGANCVGTIAPVAEFQENSSADGFAFYSGSNFPEEFRGNAFVALWGSNLPLPNVGKRIDRVILTRANGEWRGTVSEFAAGFTHPLAVAIGPTNGSLYVADHGNGKTYKIIWGGK